MGRVTDIKEKQKQIEEAFGVLVDYIKRDEYGYSLRYFDLEHSKELNRVLDHNRKPSVLAYNLYEE